MAEHDVGVVPEALLVEQVTTFVPDNVQVSVEVDGVTSCTSQVMLAGTQDQILMLGAQADGTIAMAVGCNEVS